MKKLKNIILSILILAILPARATKKQKPGNLQSALNGIWFLVRHPLQVYRNFQDKKRVSEKIENAKKEIEAGKASEKNYSGLDLSDSCAKRGTIFENTNFSNTNLQGSHFKMCDFKGTNFSNADLSNAYLKFANCVNVIFDGAKLKGVDFGGGQTNNTSFRGADLRRIEEVRERTFTKCDFSNAMFSWLHHANFHNSKFINAQFKDAYLTNINIYHSDLTNADFAKAVIRAKVTDSDLTGASFTGAEFDSSARLSGSTLTDTQWTNAKIANPKTILSARNGLWHLARARAQGATYAGENLETSLPLLCGPLDPQKIEDFHLDNY